MATVAARPRSLRRARWAVGVLFFVNGAVYANWVPRIPDAKAALGLSDGMLGLAILGGGVGALVGSLIAGPLDTCFGSRNLAVFAGVVLAVVLVGPGVAWSWITLTVALWLMAGCDAVMDVAMNAHAVAVQRGYGRSIINGFHALWSIGAVAGSLAGSVAAARGVGIVAHLAFAGLVLASAILLTLRWLRVKGSASEPAGGDHRVRGSASEPAGGDALPTAEVRVPSTIEPGADGDVRRVERARRRGLVLPTGAVGALGLMALLGGLVEDAPGSWSAVYLREALGASAGAAGLAYAAFTGAMTVGRLLGDRAVERFGAARVLRTGTLIGAGGLGTGLVLATPASAIVGFGLLGIGVSTLFPLVFATAGALTDTPAGGAIGMVSLMARAGFLLGPGLVGVIADAMGLSVALGVVVWACGAVAASAGIVIRRAERGA